MSYTVNTKKSDYKDYVHFVGNYKNGKKDDQNSVCSNDSDYSSKNSVYICSRTNSETSINSEKSDNLNPSYNSFNNYLKSYENKKFSSVKPIVSNGTQEVINERSHQQRNIEQKPQNKVIKRSEVFIEIVNPETSTSVAELSKNFQNQANVSKINLSRQNSRNNSISRMINTFENKQKNDDVDGIVLRRNSSLKKANKQFATIQKVISCKIQDQQQKDKENMIHISNNNKEVSEDKMTVVTPSPLPTQLVTQVNNDQSLKTDENIVTISKSNGFVRPPLPPGPPPFITSSSKSNDPVDDSNTSVRPPLPPGPPPVIKTSSYVSQNGIAAPASSVNENGIPVPPSLPELAPVALPNIPPPPPMMPPNFSVPKPAPNGLASNGIKKVTAINGKVQRSNSVNGSNIRECKKENFSYSTATLPKQLKNPGPVNVKTNESNLSEAAREELIKKQAYRILRGMYGAYHDDANDYVSTLPRYMVKKDNGLKNIIDNIASQGGLDKLNGRVNPKQES